MGRLRTAGATLAYVLGLWGLYLLAGADPGGPGVPMLIAMAAAWSFLFGLAACHPATVGVPILIGVVIAVLFVWGLGSTQDTYLSGETLAFVGLFVTAVSLLAVPIALGVAVGRSMFRANDRY